jgi:hypothetical protein
LSLVLEEQTDQVRNLLNLGKKRGYLLYDEVNDILSADAQPEEIDNLVSIRRRRLRAQRSKSVSKPKLSSRRKPSIARGPNST